MKKCSECGTEISERQKFCSRLCWGRNYQKTHREQINANARQKLIDNPEQVRLIRAAAARLWRSNHAEKSRSYHRKIYETGELATDDAVLFYGYKEPLRKFENGYGYQGVLSYSKDRDKVQCHFCGRLFRALNNGHLNKVHNLTAAEYKEKVQLSPQASLVGEGTREKLFKRPYNPNHMEELKKCQEKRRERLAKGLPDLQSGYKIVLEDYNKRGTCPDQLLDMIDKTVKSFGHVPTEEEFLGFHHGKYLGSIRRTFGTWTKALEKLNLRPNNISKYSREDLIEAIKNFYQVNNRTPRWSDFNRGLLPSAYLFYREFHGMNHARLAAGVPLIIHFAGRKREEWMPNDTERENMLSKY